MTGLKTKQEVIENLRDYYSEEKHGGHTLDDDQISNLILFHQTIRGVLNPEFNTAIDIESGKLKQESSLLSKVAGATSNSLEIVPGIGAALGFAVKAMVNIKDSYDEAELKKLSKNLLSHFPAKDTSEFCVFSKALATDIVEQNVDNIKDLKPEEIKDLAKQSSLFLVKELSKSEEKEAIVDQSELAESLIESFNKTKNSQKLQEKNKTVTSKEAPSPTPIPKAMKQLQEERVQSAAMGA